MLTSHHVLEKEKDGEYSSQQNHSWNGNAPWR